MRYEYNCEHCGNIEYAFRPVDLRNDPTVCPKCHKHMHRLIGTPSFIFKGTGFYETDYKKSKEQ